ncbi:hypothetical protein M8J76_015383 [Diaphorina citri]|nr:hypothetical protein M8J76_015383 [Diaphorina citri]
MGIKIFDGDCGELLEPCKDFGPAPNFGCKKSVGNTYYCICNQDGTPMREDSKCERLPSNKDPSKIHLGHFLSPKNATKVHPVIIPSQVKPPDDSNLLRAMTTSPTYQLAAMLISMFILISMIVLCCRRRKRFPFICLSKDAKAKKKARKMRNVVGMPMAFNKELLDEDRYTSNPLYTSSSMSSSDTPVPILSREAVTFSTEIGEGCFGKVFKGELISDGVSDVVAIKVLKDNASREAEEDFMREVEIMSSFRQANILSLLGVVPKEPGKKPWMVFEYMPHGDLAGVLRGNSGHFQDSNPNLPKLTKEHLLLVSQQIAAGMKYLADQRFVHRDLACRNCLVGNNLTVKIADFGMSRDVYTSDYYKIGGSRLLPVRWMPPESIMYGRFTPESDVWSYGVVLWEIYSLGKQPYFGHSNEEVLKLIVQGIMLIPPDNCPRPICEIMNLCWKTEPRDRIKFPEIVERLAKPIEEEIPLPRPPALPIATDHLSTIHRAPMYNSNEMLDEEQYLQPEGYHADPPGRFRQYFQPIPS